ncbi:hypothetical protein TrVE_jg5143 [Triparma verrucosa]|uniref:AAA+ ATPase domain-containing protein n=1 Tax=Triparma verrucosa TaxID=1606542 RepID=A0A9W7B5D0_9STRA|nr:hypothetical protein TrVE_jg5143 [Triparma verrucosa]
MPPHPANSDDPIVLTDDMDLDTTPTPPPPSSTQPWVEKYRPKSVEAVKHQTQTSNSLSAAIKSNELPHLLFYGPPGTGKTSMALALTHQLYPPTLYKSRVLEMNASDERGLSTVRNKIKTFANLTVTTPSPTDLSTHPCPPFKLIILDESDTLTTDAQSALRRIIESHSKVTRFLLICNYVSRIIMPLASRCSKFRFTPLPSEAVISKLSEISLNENLNVQEGVYELINRLSEGDMRSAVTTLQSSSNINGKVITKDIVLMTSGDIPAKDMEGLMKELKGGRYEGMQREVGDLIAGGWSGSLILKGLSDLVVESGMGDLGKAEVCLKVGEAERRLIEGGEEWLVIMDVGGCVMKGFRETN